jgi:prepilin peptidase CpaA
VWIHRCNHASPNIARAFVFSGKPFMSTRDLLVILPLFLLLAWAAVIDIRSRRIPDWLTLALMLGGLLQNGLLHGSITFGQSWAGLGVGFGLTFILFALGAMGGGDVKLFAGIGAWVGPGRIIEIFAAEALIGMVFVLWQACRTRRVRDLMRNSAVIMLNAASGDLSCPEESATKAPARHRLPYAVPTLIAAVLVLFSGRRWL